MITGINHITIAVSDLQESLHFYTKILGFTGHVKWNNGAYLTAGTLWVCLSCDTPSPSKDYSHIAFNVNSQNFDELRLRIKSHNITEWKANTSHGESLYLLDPDGHKLELHTGSLSSRLKSLQAKPYSGLSWL